LFCISFFSINLELATVIHVPITLLLIKISQGEVLKTHKINKNLFYSNWNVAGITILSIALLIGIFWALSLTMPSYLERNYENKLSIFNNKRILLLI